MTVHDDRRTWPLPFGERPELEFRSDFCAAEVVPVKAGEQPFVEVLGRGAGRLDVDVRRDGDVVRVEVDRHRSWYGSFRQREVRVVLHVPRGLRASMRTDAGSLHARDLGTCDLALQTDAGRIDVDDVSGRFRLATDAGTIRGRGLAGSFRVETAAGTIRLAIAGVEPGEHSFRTDAGSIQISLAPGLDVRIEARTGIGSVRTSYPSRDDAPAVIRASTEVGSVKIRGAGGDEPDEEVEERVWAGGFGPEFSHRFEHHFERGFGPVWPRPTPPRPPRPPTPPTPPFGFGAPAAPGTGVEDRGGAESARGPRPVDAEIERILKLVESGELSAKDADELLRALERE